MNEWTNASFVEVQIGASLDAGELIGMLKSHEPIGAWEDEGTLHFYWHEESWGPLTLEELCEGMRRMGLRPEELRIKIGTVPDQDWNSVWMQTVRPVRIGRNILVRQSWNTVDRAFDGLELIVDPKRAFGSGYHPTTQLLAEWLEEKIRGAERVLDLGTGSGILAMVAVRLGAGSALGIDTDPVAIECARENAAHNGFGAELELRTSSLDGVGSGKFDLILANLDRNSVLHCLISLKPRLNQAGSVLLSGLQPEDWDDVSACVSRAGGMICERRERHEWMALEVKFD